MESHKELACFGGGCFWCTEAIFQRVASVKDVVPGYAGGKTTNPSYREVCQGNSGHAEVIQFSFDPKQTSYELLLEIFFATHDPTTLNRQGNDVGSQYRSVIFYTTPQQKEIAESFIQKLNENGKYKSPIVTEIFPYDVFYKAEDYHHNYFNDNQAQPYCMYVIEPKIQKFLQNFK